MSTTLTKNCAKCHNTGVTYRACGADDTDVEYCTCYYGQQKERFEDEEYQDAMEKFAIFEAESTLNRLAPHLLARSKEFEENDYSNGTREAYGE